MALIKVVHPQDDGGIEGSGCFSNHAVLLFFEFVLDQVLVFPHDAQSGCQMTLIVFIVYDLWKGCLHYGVRHQQHVEDVH